MTNSVNDSQFTIILSNQKLSLKYFECRAEVIRQFITAKAYNCQNFTPPIFCHIRYKPYLMLNPRVYAVVLTQNT